MPDDLPPNISPSRHHVDLAAWIGLDGHIPAGTNREVVRPLQPGPQHSEAFVSLFFTLEAMRPQQPDSFIVQFIAPRPGAGTSVVAEGYAKVAAEGCGRPVLLVDCGRQPGTISRGRPGLVENFVDEHTLSDALVEATGTPNLLLARFSGGNHPLLEIDRGRIGPLLKALRREAAVVVLDCPPVTDPGAAALAGHADGTVLVMAAGKTRITDLADARDVLQRRGGTVMGTVFNRERHLLPRWLDRVL